MSFAAVKVMSAKWLVDMSEYLAKNPQFIVSGFNRAGILKALDVVTEDDTDDSRSTDAVDDRIDDDNDDGDDDDDCDDDDDDCDDDDGDDDDDDGDDDDEEDLEDLDKNSDEHVNRNTRIITDENPVYTPW